MRVLKLTLGKIFFLQFFLQVSVFHCQASGRSLLASDECGSGVQMVKLHLWTRAACRMHMWQRASERVSDPSERGPHKL
jgi:hypothetical protein